MKISNLSLDGVLAGLILGCALTLGLTWLSRKAPAAAMLPTPQKSNLFATEGFDFSAILEKDNDWRGPDIDEKIDLTQLKTQDGSTLATVLGKRPGMLVTVNPICGMCRVAADEMQYVRDQIAGTGIGYYPVSFTPDDGKMSFNGYTDSLGLGKLAFQWSPGAPPPQYSILNMTSPSHLLIGADGTVIKVWPGSYTDKSVRDRMGKQIVADTLIINDTLNVLNHK